MSVMEWPHLQLEVQDAIARVVMVDSARLNPLSEALQHSLLAALAHIRTQADVRAVVLTGAGRAFCVGADLASMQPAGDGRTLGQRTADSMHAVSNRLIVEIRQFPLPVVAAVNGACAGAGVGLALAADMVVAAESAFFYLPFVPKLGILPDLGSTWFLERLLGRARAMGLAALGERLSAEQAQQWGLIWQCVPVNTLQDRAGLLAQRLAALPSHGMGELRAAWERAGQQSLAEQLHYEAERQRVLIDLPAFQEGVQAFLHKREPQFHTLQTAIPPKAGA